MAIHQYFELMPARVINAGGNCANGMPAFGSQLLTRSEGECFPFEDLAGKCAIGFAMMDGVINDQWLLGF